MNQLDNWTNTVAQSFDEFLAVLGAYLPNLLGALVALLCGWLLARGVRVLILRLGRVYDRLAVRFGWQRQAHRPSAQYLPLVVLSWVLYWLVLLFALTMAADILGMPGLATWLGKLFSVLPALFGAGAIFLVGYLFASLLREAVISASSSENRARTLLMARLLHGLVIVVSAVIALGQLGIDVSLLAMLIVVAFAALAGAFGLAFGLGARSTVGNIIAAHYLRKIYRIGTCVRLDDTQGEILDFTPTAVLLENEDGIVMVPAQLFEDRVSINLSTDIEEQE
ncbi:MAG: mechanosensitive ion channel [Candidatus Thiodiazotropha sp.]